MAPAGRMKTFPGRFVPWMTSRHRQRSCSISRVSTALFAVNGLASKHGAVEAVENSRRWLDQYRPSRLASTGAQPEASDETVRRPAEAPDRASSERPAPPPPDLITHDLSIRYGPCQQLRALRALVDGQSLAARVSPRHSGHPT